MKSPRPHSLAEGYGKGVSAVSRVLGSDYDEVIRSFMNLNTDIAKIAFADQWLNVLDRSFNTAWRCVYETAKVIKDQELFKVPNRMREKTYDTFEEWWMDRMGRSLTEFRELESTYHFAQDAGILSLTYSEVRAKNTAASMRKAEPTSKRGAPKGSKNNPSGKAKSEEAKGSITTFSFGRKVRDVTYLAGRIKALAEHDSNAALVLERVERGEYRSMRQAAIDAGIIKAPDPVQIAFRAISKVPVERLKELSALLSNQVRKKLAP